MTKNINEEFEEEVWKNVNGYNGDYKISNLGRAKTYKRNKIDGEFMKLYESKRGYYVVSLCKDGKVKQRNIHALVAEAFIPNQNNKPQVNHIDGDKLNNRIDNLEWVTDHENKVHAWTTGLQSRDAHNKKTYKYSLNGELLTVYESTLEAAAKNEVFEPGISACCLNKIKTCKGFVFSYIPLTKDEILIRKSQSKIRKKYRVD